MTAAQQNTCTHYLAGITYDDVSNFLPGMTGGYVTWFEYVQRL